MQKILPAQAASQKALTEVQTPLSPSSASTAVSWPFPPIPLLWRHYSSRSAARAVGIHRTHTFCHC